MAEEKQSSSETNDDLQLDDAQLGIAGRLTRAFINSPVTPLLMMAALALGLLGLFFTPRQEDPKISVPMVDIFVKYQGASALQVASLVTEPLERLMSEIPGVRHVYSASRREDSIVTVQFVVGEDLGESIVKVHDKLQSNLDKIPPGVAQPLVKPVGIDDVPVVTVTLWSKEEDDAMLRTLAQYVLQRLKEVPDTGKGFIVGGRQEQIRIEVIPERLSGHGISLDQVANTIHTANAQKKAGTVEGGDTSFSVYTGSFLRNAREIERLVVGTRDGVAVYVRDVAKVSEVPQEASNLVTFMTGPAYQGDADHAENEAAVTIAVAKKIGTNGVTVANRIIEKLESLKGRLIPGNVEIEITRNYGKSADHKVNELLWALFEAAAAVSVLCLIGLGLRAASVVITIIPIVILITIWSAWILDYTIDRVSLFALVFSIGILVDDATVVVENIFRRWLKAGKTTVDIAIDAVREVGNPTILATITIISAMLPMGVVSGMMGPYMRPIPVLGSSAMFFSLVAAFIFAPWFAMRVRPQLKAMEQAEAKEKRTTDMIGRFYRPLMKPLIENRFFGKFFFYSLIAATFLACSLFYFQIVAVKMLPFDNKPEFNVVINMPEGTALPVTANVTMQLAQKLRDIPEVTAMQTYVATASPFNFNGMVRHYYLRQDPWQADIQVMLLDKDERERSSHELAVVARHLLTGLATELGARIQIVEMPPGPPVLQTVVAEIHGPDAETRRQVATDMTTIFERAEGVVDVDNYLAEHYEHWRFEVDTDKAVRQGISVDMINRNLAMAMGGYKLGDVKQGVVLEPTYIVIQVPLSKRSQINNLGNLPVVGDRGQIIPLAELGTFVRQAEDPVIYHKDLRAVEYVTGEMEGRLGAPIYGMFNIEDILEAEYVAPDGVKFTGMPGGLLGPPDNDNQTGIEWAGEWTVTYETFRDMGLAFMAALLLIYGLIVWEFKNFALGGLIMAPIPLTLIGIIPGHWLWSAQFTATSMIGFIALAGIIVRNSILLVEFVKQEVAAGHEIREAVVKAGQIRMRPIFITALTLMAGAAAILNDPIFQGMAVSLLFGTAVATVLTLVVIPLGCISARKHFYLLTCTTPPEEEREQEKTVQQGKPLWLTVWTVLIAVATWTFYIIRAVVLMIIALVQKFRGNKGDPGPDSGPSSPSSPSSPAGGAPTPGSVGSVSDTGSQASAETASREVVARAQPPAAPQPTATQERSAVVKPKATAADVSVESGEVSDKVTAGQKTPTAKKVASPKKAKKTAAKKAVSNKTGAETATARKTVAKKPLTSKTAAKKTTNKKTSASKKTETAAKTGSKKTKVVKKKTAAKPTARTAKPATTNQVKPAAGSNKKSSNGKAKARRGIRLKTDLD